ncbi:MAG: hypothetical protein IPN78_18415 [Candidatus Accumulibacter sp.]|nr:hypothetical protein [Candidatus Accumulibacter propinquus]
MTKMSHSRIALVLVLQPRRRNGVEKIRPEHEFEKDALLDPVLVLAIDEDLELVAVLLEFRGRGEEDSDVGGHDACSRLVRSGKTYATGARKSRAWTAAARERGPDQRAEPAEERHFAPDPTR